MSEPASDAPRPVDLLLEVQRLDTEIDQLTHRRSVLPERAVLADATAALTAWTNEGDAMRARIAELGTSIERCEDDAQELADQKTRLEAQLKTVIAPREAEALMHEIATLDEQRDALETAELEALEEQTSLEASLVELGEREAPLRAAVDAAETALADAAADLDAQIAGDARSRDDLLPDVADGLLRRYRKLRESNVVAIATLQGRQCLGCHLELSAAEVDDVKDDAAANGGAADCPQCARMLVV